MVLSHCVELWRIHNSERARANRACIYVNLTGEVKFGFGVKALPGFHSLLPNTTQIMMEVLGITCGSNDR